MCKCKDKIIITIGRTFGSGGREIGKKVAGELGIPFYDKELLEASVKEGVIRLDDAAAFGEKKPSVFLYSMAFNPYTGEVTQPLDFIIQNIQEKTIKNTANQGSCVIVGRRADKILRDEYDILSVFISATIEKRIARVSERDGLSEDDSKKGIRKADKTRRSFYNYYGEGNWGEADNYNLCIDSGDLGVDNAAALILQYLQLKGKVQQICITP